MKSLLGNRLRPLIFETLKILLKLIAHIEFKYFDGGDVLAKTGAAEYFYGWVPFIFTLDEDGQYAEQFYHDEAEVRRDTFDWYRGYDRVNFLAQLKEMHEVATLGPQTPR